MVQFDYTPARLVKSSSYWYILWYERNLDTGKRTRIRKCFNLAMIKNKRERLNHGNQHVRRINSELAAGNFYSLSTHSPTSTPEISLANAFTIAIEIKSLSDRERTRQMYKSCANIFNQYMASKKLESMPAKSFTKKHAIFYLDYLVHTRSIGPRTYNNYLIQMRALFYEMLRREMIIENPFVGIVKRKTGRKIRRAFTNYEIKILAKNIFVKDPFLALTIVLVYHTMIRPAETRRLRIQDIDLDNGIINMSGSITKNRDDSRVTIPNIILPWLRSFGLEKWPSHYLIFGAGGEPHPHKSCNHNTINFRHNKILQHLYKKGIFKDIQGLSLYSWKDTGDQMLAKSGVNILSIRDHNRHKNLSTTNAYMQTNHFRDPEIAGLDYTIIPLQC